MPGVWTAPANPPTFNVGTMLLLTDGSVLAQDSGTANWWKLTPDPAGQYVHGRWTPVRSARNAILYFASAVLRDGTVFVAGGEVANGQDDADLCAAELYDPVADQWSDLPTPDGWTKIGDAPCCVLPDGKVLLGSIADNRCAIFDPVSKTWSATGPKQNASSNEETWTLLPDGTVLTADCFGHPASERFVGASWIRNGTTDVDLVEDASHEIGPAILLPDGRVFAIGATGATAIYTPPTQRNQPGTWTRGLDFPQENGQQLAAKDAPACLLPNGRVLCVAGPVDGTADTYAGPTIFFECDPVANTLTRLPVPPANAGGAPYEGRMLLLPTGEVVFANGSTSLQFYKPDGVANQAWQPRITACPAQIAAGASVKLEGTQLNGLSQACSYGDDAAMATNYPIVRLRSVESPGTIVYCRSFNHSTMGVATGTGTQSTSFIAPKETPSGSYMLTVVANGIASPEQAMTVAAASPQVTAANRGNGAPAGPRNERELAIQHELFWRDLNEVHLLMDFVSGRSDKSLQDLKGVADPDATDGTPKDMAPDKIVQAVCKIRFPPEGTIESKAKQAAFLLIVKDRLNSLAAPARGVTVAYTAMFSGIALSQDPAKRPSKDPNGSQPLRSSGPSEPSEPPSGSSFAKESYPNLQEHAWSFKKLFTVAPKFAMYFAILTAIVYWDVAGCSTILQHIDSLNAQAAAVFTKTPAFTPIPRNCANEAGKPLDKQIQANLDACRQLVELGTQRAAERADLLALAGKRVWYHPVGWFIKLFVPKGGTSCAGPVSCDFTSTDWQVTPQERLAATVTSVFSNYVVPMLFGVLGSLAAMVRCILARVRESTLSPRDRQLAGAFVPLGVVAGLAVGLIFTTTGANAGGGTIAGAITLSASGLAFLAGYGAEAFFTALDALLQRVFSSNANGAGK